MKVIEPFYEGGTSLARIIVRFAIDPWIGMLAVGALGHRLNIPIMMHFGFFESLLVIIIIQAFSPMNRWDKYKITNKEDK